jgi:hypothetical protein
MRTACSLVGTQDDKSPKRSAGSCWEDYDNDIRDPRDPIEQIIMITEGLRDLVHHMVIEIKA